MILRFWRFCRCHLLPFLAARKLFYDRLPGRRRHGLDGGEGLAQKIQVVRPGHLIRGCEAADEVSELLHLAPATGATPPTPAHWRAFALEILHKRAGVLPAKTARRITLPHKSDHLGWVEPRNAILPDELDPGILQQMPAYLGVLAPPKTRGERASRRSGRAIAQSSYRAWICR